MKKEKYEKPETKVTQVKLEQGFMQSSANIQNPDEANGRIDEHQINDDFNFDFKDQDWTIE